MLSLSPRILDFDSSLLRQKNLIQAFHPLISDFKDLGCFCRHWMNAQTRRIIKNRLKSQLKNSITLIGSGDFHHISEILISQFSEPLSVIIFDNHPDWDILAPKFGCGSWVSRILELPNVLKVILLGVSSDDLSFPWIQSGNFRALKNNRLEIYPYSHKPSKLFLRNIPPNSSFEIENKFLYSKIYWQELKKIRLDDFMSGILKRLPTREIYLSIDKDCLRSQSSLTNWEEGKVGMNELVDMLKLIKQGADIIGADITGEYSEVNVCGRIKSLLASFDHPDDYSAKEKPQELIDSINEQANLKIIPYLKA